MAQDLLAPVATEITLDPRELVYALAQVLQATLEITNKSSNVDLSQVIPNAKTQAIAASLVKNQGHVLLGRVARGLANYSELVLLANEIARVCDGKIGTLPSLANEVGAQLVGFTPYRAAFNGYFTKGLNARQMLENQRKAYVLLNTELEQDGYSSQLALAALNKAETVVVMSAYTNDDMLEYADVILPITPFSETAGSYVNLEGTWQKFNGVTRPLGEAKPAWKILRVIANKLGLDGFEYTSIEDVRAELSNLADTSSYLNNQANIDGLKIVPAQLNGLIRFGITGIYNSDSIIRRSHSLQQTPWAKLPTLALNAKLAKILGVVDSSEVQVKQAHAQRKFTVSVCDDLADSVVLLAKNSTTLSFAGSFDAIEVNA